MEQDEAIRLLEGASMLLRAGKSLDKEHTDAMLKCLSDAGVDAPARVEVEGVRPPSFAQWPEMLSMGVTLGLKTDALNAALEQCEAALIRLTKRGLGCPASVPLWEDPKRGSECLSFHKANKEWGLYVLSHKEPQLLAHAPRHQRIAAVDRLPALLEELNVVAKQEMVMVDGATERALAFAAQVDAALK
jgi:hypothetical protein